MKNCVSRWKNPQNRMCPLTGIRGQHKTMHAAKREESTKIRASNFMMLIYCGWKGLSLTSRNWASGGAVRFTPRTPDVLGYTGQPKVPFGFPQSLVPDTGTVLPQAHNGLSQYRRSSPATYLNTRWGCGPTYPRRRPPPQKKHNLPNVLLKIKALFSLLGNK